MSKFIPTKKSLLWNYKEKVPDLQLDIHHIRQQGKDCVPCTLAMLTNSESHEFYKINNCDPVEWSLILQDYDMKLAFCNTRLCYLDEYIPELVKETYIVCIYTEDEEKILHGTSTTHAFLIHNGLIYDSNNNKISINLEFDMVYRFYYVKNIFRVVPADYPHQI
jgi:hypothetical protein